MKGESLSTDEVQLRVSSRARHLRITVRPGGAVVITRPRRVSEATAIAFLQSKKSWLLRATSKMKQVAPPISAAVRHQEYRARKERAAALVAERLAVLAPRYGFTYRRVVIRNQKTRWGSCSRRGTLSFNYRILDLSPALVDYLIVHELCHLKEMNHSARFWELVAREVPGYRADRRELRSQQR